MVFAEKVENKHADKKRELTTVESIKRRRCETNTLLLTVHQIRLLCCDIFLARLRIDVLATVGGASFGLAVEGGTSHEQES